MGELDKQAYFIRAFWDADASVWVATSDDVIGLATEADTMELLLAKLQQLVPEMLEMNGILPSAYENIPFHVQSDVDCVASVNTH